MLEVGAFLLLLFGIALIGDLLEIYKNRRK